MKAYRNQPAERSDKFIEKNRRDGEATATLTKHGAMPVCGSCVLVEVEGQWGAEISWSKRKVLCEVKQVSDRGFFVQEVGKPHRRHMVRRGEWWEYA